MKVEHWVFETPVGAYDRMENAIRACREAGLEVGTGENIKACLSDRPVNEETRMAGIKKSGKTRR